MYHARRALFGAILAIVGIAVSGETALGQARSRIEMSRPGKISRPGQNTSVDTFRRYSYGTGGLRGASGGASANVLSRSMNQSSSSVQRSYTRNPGSRGVGSSISSGLESGSSSVQRYAAPGPTIEDFSRAEYKGVMAGRKDDALGAAFAYLDSFDRSTADELLNTGSEPITTLVPDGDSRYAQYMKKAEQALKEGEYHEALGQYKMAHVIGQTDPESLLGMAHAHLATSGGISYSSAAYYLSQALNYFPELPLVQLRPRAFFGDSEHYAEIITQLRRRLDRNPRDIDALLCLAYLRWFEGESETAIRSLQTAVRYGSDAEMKEAAEMFMEGIRRVESADASESAQASEVSSP
ncbi:MAG: tetratricopeptide repeat protein [Phycisphaerae bacterium]